MEREASDGRGRQVTEKASRWGVGREVEEDAKVRVKVKVNVEAKVGVKAKMRRGIKVK
jgi:hypothetical protein